MKQLEDHQRPVFESKADIRLVQAAPGSGKTWIVAHDLGQRLESWPVGGGGIAALSFTNSARDEIRRALGSLPGHPHFIGTIDSFLLRYVVLPFAHLAGLGLTRVRLLSADYAKGLEARQRWMKNASLRVKLDDTRGAHVFTTDFVGELDGNPIFRATMPPKNEIVDLTGHEARLILERKLRVWQNPKGGWISHSDAAYISAKILTGHNRNQVLALLGKRFPYLIVDELQDTSWYHGESLRALLQQPSTKGLLVGDPDQAIFEFHGAQPVLFHRFEDLDGTERIPIAYSRRCPELVRKVARHFAADANVLKGKKQVGRARIVLFKDDGMATLRRIWKEEVESGLSPRIISREWRAIRPLQGSSASEVARIGSRPLAHLYNAVLALRDGNVKRALALASRCLGRVVFDSEVVERELLHSAGLSDREWRRALVCMIQEGHRTVEGESIRAWGERQIVAIKALLATFPPEAEALRKLPRKPANEFGQNPAFPRKEPPNGEQKLHCLVIHRAKGQTHESTIVYLPKMRSGKRCPSDAWWEADSEERRVAYVAMTRSKDSLVLCLHDSIYQRIKSKRPEFIREFEAPVPSQGTLF